MKKKDHSKSLSFLKDKSGIKIPEISIKVILLIIKDLIEKGKLNLQTMSAILDSYYTINNVLPDYIQLLDKLGEEERNIKKEISEMKRQELDRIGKEFLLNAYERRFNVTLETVISALIGEENSFWEFERIRRKRRVTD